MLDISELKGKLLPVGMMIALDYVWDQVKADRTRRKMVFIDEIWKLIGGAANKQAAEFCLEIFKIIRGYGGGALAATQDLSDFFGLEDGRYGRAILNNSKTKIILNLEPDEAEYVKDVLKLTRTEIRSITQFERGEALISSNSNKVPVIIKASREEQQMITTDRAELEAMLNELKAVADIAESGTWFFCGFDWWNGGKRCRRLNFTHITKLHSTIWRRPSSIHAVLRLSSLLELGRVLLRWLL